MLVCSLVSLSYIHFADNTVYFFLSDLVWQVLKVYQEASGVLGNIDSSSIAKEACNVLCAGLNVFYPSVSERNQLLHRLLVEGSTISIYVVLHNINNYQHNISYRLNFCSIRGIYVMIIVSSFICKIHYTSEFVTGEHIWGLAYLRDLVLIEFSELLDSYTLDLENISNLRYLDLLKRTYVCQIDSVG